MDRRTTPQPSGAERIKPYDDRQKGEQIEEMFDSIAPAYDFMNNAMSLGMHHRWRNRALEMVQAHLMADNRSEPADILDVATGTGDVALEMAARWRHARITGTDLSEKMLQEARRKLAALPERGRITFEAGDCLDLRWADNSFDLVTVAYGVRNFENLEQGYRQMCRVLRPGGLLCVVELSRPANPLLRTGYNIYTRTLIPLAGRIVSGDSRAYTYLPQSIAACPQRDDMAAVMRRAGFTDVLWRSFTLGAVTVYIAVKPGADDDTTNI